MTILWIGVGAVASILVVVCQKLVIWMSLRKEKKNILGCLREMALNIILAVLSPDYLCQKCLKRKFTKQYGVGDVDADNAKSNEHSQKLTNCIKWSNISNCVISFFVCVGAVLTAQLCGDNGWFWAMLGFIAYRTLSRTMEINISFVKDITEKDKKSTLRTGERTGLVVTSLIEEVFLFAGIYAFWLPGAQNIWVALSGGLHSMTIDAFSVVAESLKWSTELFEFVATYQKACTVLLFSLVIVSYLSNTDNKCDNILVGDNNVVCTSNVVVNVNCADKDDKEEVNAEDKVDTENDGENGCDSKDSEPTNNDTNGSSSSDSDGEENGDETPNEGNATE